MGGIYVDLMSRTSMEHLYASGETCCNGVHGANRLASNSLLESLVFAKNAAMDMQSCKSSRDRYLSALSFSMPELEKYYHIHLSDYEDIEAFHAQNRNMIWNEIDAANRQLLGEKSENGDRKIC
jgi:L-aspartate oxidase